MKKRQMPRLTVIVIFIVILAITLVVFAQNSSNKSIKASKQTISVASSQVLPKKSSSQYYFSPPPSNLAPGPNLAPGSNPSVLPSDLLIADNYGNRILVVSPNGNILWQFPPKNAAPSVTLMHPDDAFFTPNGKDIIVSQEDYQMVSIVSVAKDKIIWSYGTPNTPGSGPNQVDNPDDAMVMPNGNIISADIKNCSIIVLSRKSNTPLERIGTLNNNCYHAPPLRFGSPNGVFPLTNGNFIVTEINGDWADEMTPSGKILWSTHPPGVLYPSDTNEVGPGVYLTADYSNPGQIVEFNKYGQLLWRYKPLTGPGRLNQPSLCEAIPTNGYILCNDDSNDRVIVIDPKTGAIVWQYGHLYVPGTSPGYLYQPDGVDLAPPYSLLVRHASTMSSLPVPCYSGNPAGSCTFGANTYSNPTNAG